jgi:hypothetical protein
VLFLDDDATVEGTLSGGVLVFPEGSANAGQVWCIDRGSLLGEGQRPKGALIGHPLGKCPGTACRGYSARLLRREPGLL